MFAHWLLIGHGAFYPIESEDFYSFGSYFWQLKTFKIAFFQIFLNFDFCIWAIYHQKTEKATDIREQPFFPSEPVQNCTQKSLKKIILLHIP